MDALALLRQQAAMADRLLTQVFADVTPAQAVWRGEGSTVNAIAPLFLHVYHSEDRNVQLAQGGRPPLMAADGWQERLGYDPANAWAVPERPDLAAYRAYASAVRAATEAYLATVPAADMEREIDTPRGKRQLALTLSLYLVVHKNTHTGEIAAILGSQGIKGFPV